MTKQVSKSLKVVLCFLLCFLCFYFTQSIIILSDAKEESTRAQRALREGAIDSLVIFTGDQGRITSGLDLAKEHDIKSVLISGVGHHKNTLRNIVEEDEFSELEKEKLQVDLDYSAQNTIQNVEVTLSKIYLEQGKSILIVSSDYHIYRIKFIVSCLKKKNVENIYYMGLGQTNFFHLRKLRIMFWEIMKLFRTIITFKM